jgi:HK97 gp10 family phage protein
MFEINLDGAIEMAKRFQNAPSAVAKGSKAMMDTATLMVQGKAKELSPVDKSTLRKSILRESSAEQGRVGSNIPYAKYQEFGTGIYGPTGSPIFPKIAKMLAWKGKDGTWIRARSVSGVKPRKFLQGAVDYLKQNINQVYEIATRMIIKSL